MKKRLCISLLAAVLVLSFAGCNAARDMVDDVEEGMENLGDGMMPQDNNGNTADDGNTDNGSTDNSGSTDTADSNADAARARNGNMQRMTRYTENNLEFDIPESWQAHFMSDVSNYQNANSSQGTYSTINFYYTGTSSPTKVMTVARFPKDSWAALNEQTPEAAKKKLGESADGKWIYSLTFEENLSNDEGYTAVINEAKKLKDKIKITG